MSNLFAIPLEASGRLAIVARRRGGDWLEDDLGRLADTDVDVIVSLLCDAESVELGLTEEAALCARHAMVFVSLPVPDLGVPEDTAHFIDAVHHLTAKVCAGAGVAIHCRQSVGRSGLLAVSIAVASGVPLQTALTLVSRARGIQVPETSEQLNWLWRNAERLSSADEDDDRRNETR